MGKELVKILWLAKNLWVIQVKVSLSPTLLNTRNFISEKSSFCEHVGHKTKHHIKGKAGDQTGQSSSGEPFCIHCTALYLCILYHI